MFATACPLTGANGCHGRTVATVERLPESSEAGRGTRSNGGTVARFRRSLTLAGIRRRGRSPDRLADGGGVPAFDGGGVPAFDGGDFRTADRPDASGAVERLRGLPESLPADIGRNWRTLSSGVKRPCKRTARRDGREPVRHGRTQRRAVAARFRRWWRRIRRGRLATGAGRADASGGAACHAM